RGTIYVHRAWPHPLGPAGPHPLAHAGLAFAFGSCNQLLIEPSRGNLAVTRAARIFPLMLHELRRADARFVLLIGDQIYSETPRALSVWGVPSGPAGGRDPDLTLAAYRRIYRAILGDPAERQIREEFPAYCMWDDHDILGDWGSRD